MERIYKQKTHRSRQAESEPDIVAHTEGEAAADRERTLRTAQEIIELTFDELMKNQRFMAELLLSEEITA
jgi:hypothetical protein